MNAAFVHLGLAWLKPILTALVLPPVPLLLMAVAGILVLRRSSRWGLSMVVTACGLLWACNCSGVAHLLESALLRPSPALTVAAIREMRLHSSERVAIVVLGGGVEEFAPEYGTSSLQFRSLERLRYGIWLSRQTGWPTAFSGGIGWGQDQGGTAAEATVAQRIASDEFHHSLRWLESTSRDTHENAANTLKMLVPLGITRIVLVTDAWHMPRAINDFRRAGGSVDVSAAPIGLADDATMSALRWIPSGEGLVKTRLVLREWLGALAGA